MSGEPQYPLEPLTFKLPVRVSDPNRTQSKPPVQAEEYARGQHLFDVREIREDSDGSCILGFSFDLNRGERLIVSGIPYRDLSTGDLGSERSLQVYHNPGGFLVADKVVDGQIEKRGELVLGGKNEKGHVKILGITDKRTGDYVYEHEKQDLPDGSTQLTSTTYKFPLGNGSYSSMEITIETPDDTKNKVEIILMASFPSKLPEPIFFTKI